MNGKFKNGEFKTADEGGDSKSTRQLSDDLAIKR